jgi:hypothetical protein
MAGKPGFDRTKMLNAKRYGGDEKGLIVAERAKGTSCQKIADMVGGTRAAVYKQTLKPDIKAMIEKQTALLMEKALAPSVKTLTRFATMGNSEEMTVENVPLLKLSLDASRTVVSAATAPAGTVINNMIQVNNNNVEATEELKALGAFLRERWQAEVVDTEEVA